MKGEASEAIVRGLKAAGVDFVAILPDHGFDRVQKRIAEDDVFTYAPVSNESVGAGVCAGAFFGGKTPALMIPTSGFLVAAWPIRCPIRYSVAKSRKAASCGIRI